MTHAHDALTHRRDHSRAERRADGVIHVAGLLSALAGAAVLLLLAAGHDKPGRLASVTIYALGVISTFAASAAYNLGYYTRFRAMLRRLDHSAIFLMIAGTYTPLMSQFVSGPLGVVALGAIWTVAALGVGLKLGHPKLFERIGVGFYLLLGWIGVVVFAPYAFGLPPLAFWTLVAGGLLYTAGVAFHVWDGLPYQNAIWHSFVLAAAACHWFSILNAVVLAS